MKKIIFVFIVLLLLALFVFGGFVLYKKFKISENQKSVAKVFNNEINVQRIKPSQTDKEINDPNNDYLVATSKISEKTNKLVIFLPGTFGNPDDYSLLNSWLADQGYYSISISYPNDSAVVSVCKNSFDEDCAGKIREERFSGKDKSELVKVSQSNSIENRIQKLLVYLKKNDKNNNWSQFLKNDETNWSNIIVSGHSQGGGMVAYIAKKRLVDRAVMFSGPGDWDYKTEKSSKWLYESSITPANRYFTVRHVKEPSTEIIQSNFEALGLSEFGPEKEYTDYSSLNNTHRILLKIEPKEASIGIFNNFHSASVTDKFTPVDKDGKPILNDVWKFLFST
jgi:dienelactone hydrolase